MDLLYSENKTGRFGWITVAAMAILAIIGLAANNAYVILPIVLLFPVALILVSLDMYSSIILTKDGLKVGREKLSVSELDPKYGAKKSEDVLSSKEFGSLELGTKSTRKDGLRIMGGAWGRPKVGTKWVVVKAKTSPDLLLIASKHPNELISKLNQLISAKN